MFEMIFRWLGFGPSRASDKQVATRRLNVVAPLKSAPQKVVAADQNRECSFICREEVLNRNENIEGYEFSLSRELKSRTLERNERVQRVYDDAILRNLARSGVSSLLGNRFALIRLSPASLKNPLLDRFSQANLVVMITPGEMSKTELSGVRNELLRLRGLGIKHGWTLDKPWPELVEYLSEADFIEVESSAFDGVQMKMMYRELRAINGQTKLVASGLVSIDDFNLCFHCGFDYFMGAFILSRENWHPEKSEINRQRVMEVLNMIRSGAEFDAIAERLRTEPVLTFKLLRYINSAGFGMQRKVGEISHALMILGRERFYRWLSLLLFDFKRLGYRERVLNEQALARARFLEVLAGQGRVPAVADQLFLVGLFSLMDVMMGQPLEEILKQVSLPDAVTVALKGAPGPVHDALMLSVAVESGTPREMDAAAEQCGLDALAVTDTMIEALTWSQRMSAVGE